MVFCDHKAQQIISETGFFYHVHMLVFCWALQFLLGWALCHKNGLTLPRASKTANRTSRFWLLKHVPSVLKIAKFWNSGIVWFCDMQNSWVLQLSFPCNRNACTGKKSFWIETSLYLYVRFSAVRMYDGIFVHGCSLVRLKSSCMWGKKWRFWCIFSNWWLNARKT